MKEKSSIKVNLALQTAYRILSTILPLITAPFLSRVLGATQLGVYSFTNSIVLYFSRFAMLGTVNHGTRTIAAYKSDKAEMSKKFWSIYVLQMLFSGISILLYIGYLLFICKENRDIASIQAIAVIGCFFNVTWLFFGLEHFKLTVTRNFFVRILTVVLILCVVKNQGDLWKYALIMVSGTMISDLVVWISAPKYVSFTRVSYKDVIQHLKPILVLFVPILALSVYHTMDKTMLGILSTYEESGFYYNADKVINVPIGILTGVGTVLLPRITYLVSNGRKEEGNRLFLYSLEGIGFLGIAIALGIASVAKEFTPIFFGPGYDACIPLMIVLAPVLVIKSVSSAFKMQHLMPNHKDRVYIKAVIAGAIVNIIINAALIPKLGAMGAVIGTLVAELVACLIQFWVVKNDVNLKPAFLHIFAYLLIGLAMFGAVRGVSYVKLPLLIKLFVEIISGAVVYLFLCFFYWKITKNDMLKTVFGSTLKKLHINI